MKKFFSTGVVFGLGLSSFATVGQAQYYGSPAPQGLASSGYVTGQPISPYRIESSPLRIGANYPQLAQQGFQPVHQHVGGGSPIQAFPNQSGLPAPAQQVIGNVIQAQAGPMSVSPAQVAPLPPVNAGNPYSQGTSGSEYIAPLQPIPMNSTFQDGGHSSYQQPQQNFEHYPSTHASTYGNYGSTPSNGLYQSSQSNGCATCASTSYAPSYAPSSYVAGPTSLSPWIFGASGLIFRRIDDDNVRLSSDSNNPRPPYLTTGDAKMQTAGGYELMGGRYFGCGKYAILGSYWSLLPSDESRTVYGGGTTGVNLYTDVPFNITPGSSVVEHGITMPGNDAYFWYNNAQAHQIVRGQDFNNAEVNFASFALGGAARQGFGGGGFGGGGFGGGGWNNGRFGRSGYAGNSQGCGGCGSCGQSSCNTCPQSCSVPCSGPTGACGPIVGASCSPLRFTWFGGVRWFQFKDRLMYTTSQDDAIIGNGTDFLYRNRVQNDLVGFQLGGLANYCCGSRLSLYAGSKFGVFNNRSQFDSFAGNSTTAATVQNGAYLGQAYNLASTENNVAFLGEGELGGRVRVSNGWSATCGYRLIGVSGIATAPGQIPYNFSRIDDARDIKTNDSLLLHGITIGGIYNW